VGQVFNLPKLWQVENLPHEKNRRFRGETGSSRSLRTTTTGAP
jgi:hypothetical protein